MLNTLGISAITSQLSELKKFGGRINKFGADFAVYEADGDIVLLSSCGRFESRPDVLIRCGKEALQQHCERAERERDDAEMYRLGEDRSVLAAVLCGERQGQTLAALIDPGPNTTVDLADAQGAEGLVHGRGDYLQEMLRLLSENLRTRGGAQKQVEKMGAELAQTYEELVLLHKLSTNMKVTESGANFLQMACDNLTDIVLVEGIAILLEKTIDDEKRLVVAAGSGLIDIDEHKAAILSGRLTDEMNNGGEALLDSAVDTPFKYEWADYIKSIIAVPLFGKDKQDSHLSAGAHHNGIVGLMVAVNSIGKPDFDSTDIKLFNSVANGCAVFIENGRLFEDLKELFIGSLKALTSSIDAKDPYTHGHSERVAYISRWIAQRLAQEGYLEEEEIHKVYLAGLLHDIGKIGIEETLLRKKDRLTEEERSCIEKHPSIGAAILTSIKQMREIVPGVLYHHERVDGTGYPSGMKSEEIPLIGKIVGLADSFDAMTSKRTYRDARSVEQALAEIEKGLGKQFDEKVGRVFLDGDIYQLWEIIQDGRPDSFGLYTSDDLSEYGITAVGTLIR